METFVAVALTACSGFLALRLLLLPMKLLFRLLIHSACGFLCLWSLNAAAGLTGILLPINSVTVLTAGFLGVPGIALTVLLEGMV